MLPDPQTALSRALDFLCRQQLDDGELRTYIAANPALAGECSFDSSPFVTAIAVDSLGFVADPRATAIRRRAVEFLRREGEAPGIWRYWTSRSGKAIAPDVDDTALISHVLRQPAAGAHRFDNQDLLLANRNGQGLFYTWLKGYGEKNDVDSVVNANVLLYLGERDGTRAVCEYLEDIVRDGGGVRSYWYYLSDLALYHAISRAFFHGVSRLEALRAPIRDRLLADQRQDGGFGDELATALAICTLLNFGDGQGPAAGRAAGHLLTAQRADGAWRRIAYYCGPEPPAPHSRWFGSEELTTVLSIEALARHGGARG
jgi:hypothetical protein